MARVPKQERAIETKNKIIEAGVKVFADKGYYNTNTAEIAKLAGVSTGIVYGYFNDKKDIFLCALKLYLDKINTPIVRALEGISKYTLKELIVSIVDIYVDTHKQDMCMHKEVESMIHQDADIYREYNNIQYSKEKAFMECLGSYNVNMSHIHEKVHIILHMVEEYCHTALEDTECVLDKDVMKNYVVDMILYLLESKTC